MRVCVSIYIYICMYAEYMYGFTVCVCICMCVCWCEPRTLCCLAFEDVINMHMYMEYDKMDMLTTISNSTQPTNDKHKCIHV
jgi:hypothetical protein